MKTKRRQVNDFYRGEIARMFEQLSAAEETIGAPAVGGAFESVGGGLQFGGKNGENGVTSGAWNAVQFSLATLSSHHHSPTSFDLCRPL